MEAVGGERLEALDERTLVYTVHRRRPALVICGQRRTRRLGG